MIAGGAAWNPAHGVFLVLLIPAVVVRASAEVRQAVEHRPEALAARLGLLFLWCGAALRSWCFHTLGGTSP